MTRMRHGSRHAAPSDPPHRPLPTLAAAGGRAVTRFQASPRRRWYTFGLLMLGAGAILSALSLLAGPGAAPPLSPLDYATTGPAAPDDNHDQIAVQQENRVLFDVSAPMGFTDPDITPDGATWSAHVPWPGVVDASGTPMSQGMRVRVVAPVAVMTKAHPITARLGIQRFSTVATGLDCHGQVQPLGFVAAPTADGAAVAGVAHAQHTFGSDTAGWWAVADVTWAPGGTQCTLMDFLLGYQFTADATGH